MNLLFNGPVTFSSIAGDTRSVILDMTASTTTPGSGYDQIVCGGAVTAGSAKLTFNLTSVPAIGAQYILVSKTNAGEISGFFRDSSNAVPTGGSPERHP